jgi:hypothetical protein
MLRPDRSGLIVFGPHDNNYPELLIRSYYNGTDVWEANSR